MSTVTINQNPLVSVLMTAYNREKYIGQAIESVLASTYTNFELIIVDDGSKDQTVQISSKYASEDDRVKVYINEKNLGDYPNRNQAASYATGKYLKYVDADDFIYPWGLQLMVNTMEAFPHSSWGLASLPPDEEKPFPFVLNSNEAYRYHYFGPGLFHKAPLSAIINRALFEEVGGFRAIRMAGDFEMWHRLAQRYPVVLMQQGIVWYRKHGDQEVRSYQQYLDTYEEIMFDYLKSDDCPLDKTDREILLKRGRQRILKDILKAGVTLNFRRFNNAASRYKKV